jgi:hypothetical protein
MAKLVIHPGTPQARAFELKPGTNYVGRGFANDIKIEEGSVSSSHAQVLVNGPSIIIKDLGSTNGTFINQMKITESPLKPGLRFRLGGVEVAIEADAASAAPVAAAAVAIAAAPPAVPASPPPTAPPIPKISLPPAPTAAAPKPAAPGPSIATTIMTKPPPVAPASAPAAAAPVAAAAAPTTTAGPALRIPPPTGTSAAAVVRIPASTPATAIGGLKVSSPSAPPPPPTVTIAAPPPPPAAPPPEAPPIPVMATVDPGRKTICKFHPKALARWMCQQCSQLYCDMCVAPRPTPEGTGHFCRSCGGVCVPVQARVEINPLEQGNFFTHLPGAFTYPFKRGGGFLLLCATLFLAFIDALRYVPIGGIIIFIAWGMTVMYYGYLYSYLQNVIHTTAHGDEHEPSLPDITDIGQDLVAPFLQLVCTVILCFGATLVCMVWALWFEGGPTGVVMAVAAGLFGCFYFPMAFLTVAMFDTVGGINPMVVLPAIFKFPLQYLVAFVLLTAGVCFYLYGLKGLPELIPIPILPRLIGGFIFLYLLTVMSRILGLLYYLNRRKLGWFND